MSAPENPQAFGLEPAIAELRHWLAVPNADVRVMGRLIISATLDCIHFTGGGDVAFTPWAALPDGLRHGITRLAAHRYRFSGDDLPPAVAALWRPWRRFPEALLATRQEKQQ